MDFRPPTLVLSCKSSRLSVKECNLGFLFGSCTKTSYDSVQNLKQVKMSSKKSLLLHKHLIVDLLYIVF
jgi:hypothetical protein